MSDPSADSFAAEAAPPRSEATSHSFREDAPDACSGDFADGADEQEEEEGRVEAIDDDDDEADRDNQSAVPSATHDGSNDPFAEEEVDDVDARIDAMIKTVTPSSRRLLEEELDRHRDISLPSPGGDASPDIFNPAPAPADDTADSGASSPYRPTLGLGTGTLSQRKRQAAALSAIQEAGRRVLNERRSSATPPPPPPAASEPSMEESSGTAGSYVVPAVAPLDATASSVVEPEPEPEPEPRVEETEEEEADVKEVPEPPPSDPADWTRDGSMEDGVACPVSVSTGYSTIAHRYGPGGSQEEPSGDEPTALRRALDSCAAIRARNLPAIRTARDSLAQEADALFEELVGSAARGQPPRVNHTGLQILPCQFPLFGNWQGCIKTPSDACPYVLTVNETDDLRTYRGTHSTAEASSDVIVTVDEYHVTIEDEDIILEGSLDPNRGTMVGKLYSKAGDNAFPFCLSLEAEPAEEAGEGALQPKIDRSQLRKEASILAKLHGIVLPPSLQTPQTPHAAQSPPRGGGAPSSPSAKGLRFSQKLASAIAGPQMCRRGSAGGASPRRDHDTTTTSAAGSKRRKRATAASPARHVTGRDTYASFKSSVDRFPKERPDRDLQNFYIRPRTPYTPRGLTSPPPTAPAPVSPFRSTTERFPQGKPAYDSHALNYVHPRNIEYGLKPAGSRVVMG